MPESYDEDNIDSLFRESLRYGERTPVSPVWSNIEAELNKGRRRRLLLWWLPVFAAVAVIVILKIGPSSKGSVPIRLQSSDRAGNMGRPSTPGERNPVATQVRIDQHMLSGRMRHLSIPGQYLPAMDNSISDRSDSYSLRLPGLVNTSPGDRPGIWIGKPVFNTRLAAPARQGPPGINRRHSTFTLTAYLSQELAAYSLADHDSTGPSGREIEKRQNSSFSTSVGLLAAYSFAHNWVIESGVGLSRSLSVANSGKAVAVKDNTGNVSYQVNTVTGYGYLASPGAANIGDSVTTGKTTGTLDYVSIPFAASRSWSKKRITFLAGAGISTNFLTRATEQTSLADPTSNNPTKELTQYGLKKVTFGMLLKGELRYQFSPSYAFSMLATFKSSVGPVNTHTSYRTYPYNLGFGIGFTRIF